METAEEILADRNAVRTELVRMQALLDGGNATGGNSGNIGGDGNNVGGGGLAESLMRNLLSQNNTDVGAKVKPDSHSGLEKIMTPSIGRPHWRKFRKTLMKNLIKSDAIYEKLLVECVQCPTAQVAIRKIDKFGTTFGETCVLSMELARFRACEIIGGSLVTGEWLARFEDLEEFIILIKIIDFVDFLP